jgi:ABC-type multidrug transport system ATPase subunit
LLSINNLTKRYGSRVALDAVSFSIRSGEILGVIGPNGSGKTTLFECLGGVLPADHLTIAAGDRTLTPAERRTHLFYLPDNIAPWPGETVGWALGHMSRLFEAGDPLRLEVIRLLALESLLVRRIGDLSKGERKRSTLAMSLLTNRPVIFADEPFDGLDLRQTREVAHALRSWVSSGRTLCLSMHQIGDAARVCDRFVLLSNGSVRGEGTHDELRQRVAMPTSAPLDLEDVFVALT